MLRVRKRSIPTWRPSLMAMIMPLLPSKIWKRRRGTLATRPQSRAAFDTICETIIGVEMNSQDKGSDKFIDSMNTYLGIGTQMFLKPWLLNPIIVRLTSYHKEMTESAAYMTSFCNELINKKKKEYRERTKDLIPTKKHSDSFTKRDQPLLIDSIIEMIENNKCFFSKKEIIGEINYMIMAGLDTTATSLSFTMMLLGFHQDVQKKLLEEIDTVFWR
uniref:Cytochrome P450 n=1 Tax=Timema tahoe TaxID=61484 RepID=A0A7R9NZB4_9NEOP|nr:unnamed protein product [Timema tahoe]